MPNTENLKDYARQIASEYGAVKNGRTLRRRFPRLDEDNSLLINAYKSINEEVKSKGSIVPAAEWLLDNFYLIEEQVKEIQHNITRRSFKDLPLANDGRYKGYPRVYGIASDLVSFTDGWIDEDTIIEFLNEYQTESPLANEELWAFPLMLRICLLQKIKDIAVTIIESIKDRKLADEWFDRLIEAQTESRDGNGKADKLRDTISEHDLKIGLLRPAYAERLLQKLRSEGTDAAPIIRWVDGKLAVQRTGADDIIQLVHQQQTASQVSIGNSITSLRFISSLKWEDTFERLSLLENILRQDPARIYHLMDFASRDYYRHNIEKMAKRNRTDEVFIARKAVECAIEAEENGDIRYSHVGYYIIGKGISTLEHKLGYDGRMSLVRHIDANAKLYYFGLIGTVTALLLFTFIFFIYKTSAAYNIWLFILSTAIAFIPVLSIATGLVNWLVTRIRRPKLIPKLELKEGIPEEYRTMVVIPTLLTSEKRVVELIEQMEVFYLANQEENLHFALVGDFKDGPEEKASDDGAIIETAKRMITELNNKYGRDRKDIFFFFHRYRQWNPNQKSWMGWERKRGAVAEFNALLSGNEQTSYFVKEGDLSVLKKIAFVITLDADTQLPRDAAKRLVGAMAHPLNAPVLSDDGSVVKEGYGLLQPRIGVSVDSASRSFFSLTFSGQTGIDPYTTATSDVYQDLFSEGIFTGKGIYRPDIFDKVLNESIPENSVLSHDLLEGSYVRAGLVTDIELVDGYPAHYMAYSMRLHRWVRGDWQLLPWLGRRVRNRSGLLTKNPLNIVSKWKIFDNLRRSLLSPALYLMLVLSYMVLPGSILLWIGLAVLTFVFPLILDMTGTLLAKKPAGGSNGRFTGFFRNTGNLIWQIILSFVFLSHQAWLMLDAVSRTVWRVTVSHRNMLEWVTAADSERKFKGNHVDFWRKMKESVLLSVLLSVISAFVRPAYLPYILISTVIWASAPYVAYRVSRQKSKRIPLLSEEQILKIRRIGRKTWMYFDELVDERGNFLPPDNYQQDPPVGVAHRTSPTNIGLYLLSVLAARDLGYVTTLDAVVRIENTIATMNKLEKWNGHYYNWYNTLTLEPLRPLYVSTVDNGNLIGYLITLIQGIDELLKRPIIGRENVLGLRDILVTDCEIDDTEHQSLLNMFVSSGTISTAEWQMLLDDLKGQGRPLDDIIRRYEEEMEQFIPWTKLLQKIPAPLLNEKGAYRNASAKLNELLQKLNGPLSLQSIVDHYLDILKSLSETIACLHKDANKSSGFQEARNWLKQLEISLAGSYSAIKSFSARCWKLRKEIDNIMKGMDFKLLYDEKRELFSIGYNAEEGQLTKSYYDLLASEARQASFIAIAKGDIPQKHWFKLGRSLTLVGDSRVLISWSGTMFEYLMPLLIMKNYEYTLLDETYSAVVRAQRQYTEQRHIPWGVSESGFYAFDLHLNYQYKAFGVPQLGLKRGLVNDLVVSPYATVLALPVEPAAACKNIEALIAEGMEGPFGLYEAIDYTPERLPKKRKSMTIRSFMAHHQGMSLVAINNYLNNNIMQTRFHSAPMIKATELLLQERMPRSEIYIKEYEEFDMPDLEQGRQHQEIRSRRMFNTANTVLPEISLLSNGNYTVMLTNSGGGFSQYMGQAISRWREDKTRDNWGMMFYIMNLNSNNYWSAACQPAGGVPESYCVSFETDRAVFQRKDGNIETKTEIVVSPEYNGEVRRISLTNHSDSIRIMEVTSYFEVVLASFAADTAHPAFSNLFVQTEYVQEYNTLLATRRPRDKKVKPLWLFHTVVTDGTTIGSVQYETDRFKFLGRGRTPANPQVMDPGYPLSNTAGAVLDPVISLRRRLSLEPGETVQISFITGVSDTREAAVALARDCQNGNTADRAFELAWTHSQVELRYLNISAGQANMYQNMASRILYTGLPCKWKCDNVRMNKKGQSSLWAYGISGDLPIIVVRVSELDHMELVRQMLTAHEYLRLKGINTDLVLLNEFGNSYEQPVQERLGELVSISHARDLLDRSGGVYIRQSSNIPEEDLCLLFSAARLVLNGEDGPLAMQLNVDYKPFEPEPLDAAPADYRLIDPDENEYVENLIYYNGTGGFSEDGKEYVINLKNKDVTPLPWSNIVANPDFGFLVTESGSGYTWCLNSRENKLTPWSNDPVSDPPGEVIYVRDEKTGDYWTITPLPIRQEESYIIRHSQGCSVFEHQSFSIKQKQRMFVPIDSPVKIVWITLKNISDKPRTLSLTYYVEWVLGVSKDKNAPYIVTDYDKNTGILTAVNRYNEEFAGRTAFLASSLNVSAYTTDRTEFIGRNGSLTEPQAMAAVSLSGVTGSCMDPCGALRVLMELQPGEVKEVVFMLGQGDSEEHAREIANTYKLPDNAQKALNAALAFWESKLGKLQVKTPDKSMDLLLNRWLVYQTYACRIWARTAFYQAGGAFGFRDQLQDSMAVIYSDPERTREQILLSAAHQFIEGDVQHWWHPPLRGVRTRITDDLLFLPFVTADYIENTGDWSILSEEVCFINDRILEPEEHDRYNIPQISEEKADIYEHCKRAIEKSLRFGKHGLPLIGTGDWNDGMDRVGPDGKGESVWLGWFLYTVLMRFIPICRERNDSELAERYEKTAAKLLKSIENNAWDGGWYRRAYFDDGTPLGSESNDECRIDSISQSWAVISGNARHARLKEAMRAVLHNLVDRESGLIKLLTPPFNKSALEPGYIKGYLPGVRENGGQYTHAAVWTIMAFARLGDGDMAWSLYNMINPVNHTDTGLGVQRYKCEPYVMAADVYAVNPHSGRGGWTWYTGSAGWMYRVGINEILGFNLHGSRLEVNPCIPAGWGMYEIEYRYGDSGKTLYKIKVENPYKVSRGVDSVELDGNTIEGNSVELSDDGNEHIITVRMGTGG